MRTKVFICGIIGFVSLGLLTAGATESAPRRGLQRGDCPREECTGECQMEARERQGLRQGPRAEERGQGRGQGSFRQGEGRGRGHHRDGTGARG